MARPTNERGDAVDDEWRALALRLMAQVSYLIEDPAEAAAIRTQVERAVADSDDAASDAASDPGSSPRLQAVLEAIVRQHPALRPWFELNRPLGARGWGSTPTPPGQVLSGGEPGQPRKRRARWRRPRLRTSLRDKDGARRRPPTRDRAPGAEAEPPPPSLEISPPPDDSASEPSRETPGRPRFLDDELPLDLARFRELPDGGDSTADQADTTYPRLDAPARVGPGEPFTVTAGLRAEADVDLVSTGSMTALREVDLQVCLQFDPLAFALLKPAEVETIRRTADDPFPAVEFTLVALAGAGLTPERRVEVKFLREGQLVGFASRAVVVGTPAPTAPAVDEVMDDEVMDSGTVPFADLFAATTRRPAPDSPPEQEPEQEPVYAQADRSEDGAARQTGMLDLGPLLAEAAPDLVVVIRPSADTARVRLVFTAHGPHPDLADRSTPLTQTLIGEANTGTNPEQLGRDLRQKMMDPVDQVDLFRWLQGLGDRVHRSMPTAITAAIRQTVARGTRDRPATILIISEEPYVPWELAADPEGWPAGPGGDSPFLGAHAAISRWFLAERPPPTAKPASCLQIRTKALVTADYSTVAGAAPLPEAQAEVAQLSTDLAPGVATVAPRLRAVLDLLDGDPPADLLHFALHGRFEAEGPDGGLLLLGEGVANGRTQLLQDNHVRGGRLRRAPFVYLNACQLAASDNRALGDYAGLATSFLYAGAGAVLAPLWNVQDDTAGAMAVDFYRQARAQEAPSAAEVLRRFRARYTRAAVRDGVPGVDATLVAYQLFAHPRLTLDLVDGSEQPLVIDLRSAEEAAEAAEATTTARSTPG